MQHVTGLVRDRTTTDILLTASDAFPAFERAVLESQAEIWASFRIFDPRTRLRSPEARAVGDTWFDLLVDALRRGVRIDLTIADFDPIAQPSLHRGTWASLRQMVAAGEASGAPGRLRVRAALHPATTGLLPRAALWPQAAVRLARTARWLNARDLTRRAAALRDMPGLAGLLAQGPDGRVRARAFRPPMLHPATHHQKLAVFDRRRLYIGGLDLDDRRWNSPDHDRPGEGTWQGLQLMIEGPIVAEAQAHLERFRHVTARQASPAPQRRLLRTLSRPRGGLWAGFGPEPVTQEILDAHEMLAAKARRLIYLETQFFRDTRLARRLARAARERPELGLILILPAAPEDVAFGRAWSIDTRIRKHMQARCLHILGEAFGPRLFVGAAAQPRREAAGGTGDPQAAGPEAEPIAATTFDEGNGRERLLGEPIVHIHAKVSIFDDAAIVSSANLTGCSLRWDTEAGVLLTAPKVVQRLRERVMGYWLPADADSRYLDPDRAVALWQRLALRNSRLPPERREGFVLPYDIAAAERIARSVPLVPEEMV
ncbi:phospholipase D-like domain-containing protein [Rubellimicrobium aerolatum]|uniref:Phosphatidylserine/phosphatidylglycerophosphate/ cardiolipin synthase family protein n=1 Tax=Rubellimicrobium aerolatum TaxID=490979 RepID=A0ABW0SG51_9RHOB|nr:phospholipase D-like domain-containing protein [Rubellimicrobium aerolatum]MBP1806422.1 phospholipase D1/2 [Rubellimicrobium aerolatum]